MVRWILTSAAALAVIDPVLLYWIYTDHGFWPAVTAYFGPIVLAGYLFPWAKRRVLAAAEGQPGFGVMAEVVALRAAAMLVWYPGPVTSCLGLALLFPFGRRLAALLSAFIVLRNIARTDAAAGDAGVRYERPGAAGSVIDDLKRAEGKVIDSDSELPPSPQPSDGRP